MERILGQKSYEFVKEIVMLPAELENLVTLGFRAERDCILFKNVDYFGIGILDSDFGKTAYEDFENHIHIDNNSLDVIDEFEYLKVGLEFAKRIYAKLDSLFRNQFRIIVSYSETIYENEEINTYGGCVVRFYMIRSSCDDKYRVDDLDKYEDEGVLVIE
ncbi:hypothetical protein [Pseudochryseolinea flava]|nr:hypothetical protein [Pseudochryseolinea flava]